MKKNIKMRVNTKTETVCDQCKTSYNDTREMYDILIFGDIYHICYSCNEELFSKCLKASCFYNSKVKKKEDINRARREDIKKGIGGDGA